MNKTLAELGDTVTDTLSDAWSTTSSFAQDLASNAAEVAGDQLSDGADRVSSLYGKARDRVRPPKRHVSPWLVVVAGLATFVAVGWWLRRRSQSTAASDRPGDGTNPLAGEYSSDARAAARA